MVQNLTRTVFCLFLPLMITITGCREDEAQLYTLPAFSDSGVHAVIEIPAGTNHKIEYDPAAGRFVNDTLRGKKRVVNFLPYPGNYGFIPSTLMDKARGGDGDALDILVLSESVPTGTVLSVKPIAALLLSDQGELDTKIIAVPLDSALRIMPIEEFSQFITEYSAVQQIIQEWFLSYKGFGQTRLLGWKNSRFARREIEKWALKGELKANM